MPGPHHVGPRSESQDEWPRDVAAFATTRALLSTTSCGLPLLDNALNRHAPPFTYRRLIDAPCDGPLHRITLTPPPTTRAPFWGELRSLLHRATPARPKHWEALLHLIERIEDRPERLQAIAYARQVMTSSLWPDAVRVFDLEHTGRMPHLPEKPEHWPLVRALVCQQSVTGLLPWLDASDATITSLTFRWHTLTREELRAILATPALARLEALHIETSWMEGDTLEALREAPCVPSLRAFTLCDLEPEHALKVANLLATLPRLEALSCPGSLYSNAEVKRFCQGVTRPLVALDLSWTSSPSKFIKALAGRALLDSLERLVVSNLDLTSATVKQLCALPTTALHTLVLSNGKLGHRAMEALANAPFAPSLRHLDLSDNSLRTISKSMAALATSPILPSLETLDLSSTDLAPKPLQRLLDHPLPSLRRLCVRRNQHLTDRGAEILLSGNMPALQELDLEDHFMSFDALLTLCEGAAIAWPALEEIHLSPYGTDDLTLSPAQLETLRAALSPSTRLHAGGARQGFEP